ncbi:phasin family protein [Halopseudomonas phragmitis]|uniref:Poly(3-hydroxyalkanoate) granule-associated protein PhaF n=2 Tax=Pseudomonadaceae TaxID=135621 RepID=A0A1V0B1T3_9GAMM|nr:MULTISPECIES: phasin family protein [Pseudomonadaceae]AQZ93896.1 poly(3-hydroxyalkanoate) granule-associated protein PhaF [Halopseudomonas phragmitis]RHW20485.1 poly(3-hydroxyalkanoate) granule-associated protein PhaF [Pseudomonas jilinensis]
MAGKKKQEKDAGWVSEIEKYSRQIWLAGLGAYAKMGKEGVKLFEGLIKDGEAAEKAAKAEIDKQVEAIKGKADKGKKDSLDAAKTKVEKAKDKVTGKWSELEEAFDKRLNNAVSRLGVPSRDEIKALNAKVDELTKLIGQLSGTKAPAAKVAPKATPKAAAKPAAKPAAAKPAAKPKPAAKAAAAKAPAAKPVAKPAAKPAAPAKPKAAAKPKAPAKPRAPAKPKATPAATKAAEPAPSAAPAATPAAAPAAPSTPASTS